MNLNGIEAVGEDDRTPVIRPGRYTVELESVMAGTSKKSGLDFIKSEVKVLEAKGEDSTRAGDKAVFFINEDLKWKKHLGQIADYVRALDGNTSITVTDQMVVALTSGKTDISGTKFDLEATIVTDKTTGAPKKFKDGSPILNLRFMPATAMTPVPVTAGTNSTKAARK